MKLKFRFFKTQPKDLENLSKESFVDIISQNLFLKRLVFFLLSGLIAALAVIAIQAHQKMETIIVAQPPTVSYHDVPIYAPAENVATSTGTPSTQTNQPPTQTDADDDGNESKPQHKEHSARRKRSNIPAAVQPASPPPAIQAKRPGLWDLSDRLNADPRREILEKVFGADGITVKFKVASPEGLIQFQIANETQSPIYMPNLQVQNKRSLVFLERRVLEAGSDETGVLQIQNLDGARKLSLVFSAANVKPMSISLEVPQW